MTNSAAPRRSMGGDRLDLALILILAIVVRAVWMVAANATTDFVDLGEATHVAIALAQQGRFADAYFAGQGATAHLLPTSVGIAGAIYALFGYPAPAANLALAAWALLQTVLVFTALWITFRKIGIAPMALRIALVLLAISPAFLAQEAADFRVWEGALAVCLALASLAWLFTLDARETITTRDLALASILAAATFFVSPAAGIAIDGCWGLFALRRFSIGRSAGFALLGMGALAIVVAPWSLRNDVALGTPVLLRSNFGLELALANHAGALNGHPRIDIFNTQVGRIHPFNSPAAAAQVRTMGEVAYAQWRGREAWRWIAAHPTAFVQLCGRLYRQFYLPDSWQMQATIWRNWIWPRVIAIWLASAFGVAGLAAGVWQRRRGYDYLAVYAALAGLPYALVQPVPRYSYLVYGVLAIVAVDLVVAIVRRWRYSSRAVAASGIAR